MRKIWQSKWFRYPFWTFVFSFAAIGFFLSASYVAIKFRLTDEKGSVDANNRYFEGMEDKYNQAYKLNSEQLKALHFESLDRILLLKKFYPKNAQYILDAWKASNNEVEVKRMIDAVDIQLKSNRVYQQKRRQLKREKNQQKKSGNLLSAFEWMNIQEWSDFKMSPDLNKDLNANIELTFGVFTKNVNFWTGVITVESYGGIRRDLSWVNPQLETQQLLNYLQLKYEIAHFFAKQSEKEINSKKINAGNVNKINGIIETYLNARDKSLNEFDIESNFGKNAEVIDKWKQKLSNNEI